MPPLGRALMGLWASEAYSFHTVSTSRFPSILFHNTPGDVYVLQDARKMRSRLHSDIGRFTAGDEENRVEGRKRRHAAILAREIELGFARASRLLFASAIRRILRTELRPLRVSLSLSLVYMHTYLRSRCEIRYLRTPRGQFSRELNAPYLPETERKTNYSKIARR